MVRTKEKKKANKGDDAFKDRHQKVGRKKLAPSTATRAEVHARSLRVDVQRSVAAEQQRQRNLRPSSTEESAAAAAAAADSGPSPAEDREQQAAAIAEALVGIVHYRAVSRKTALNCALKWLRHRENNSGLVAPVRTLQLLEKALSCLTDTDGEVRVAARGVVQFVVTKTLPLNTAVVDAVSGVILRYINIALTHAEKEVRNGTLELLGKMLLSEEAYWLEGVDDARERSNFLRVVVASQPVLHEEVLSFVEAAFNCTKATKDYAAYSAVLRSVLLGGAAGGAASDDEYLTDGRGQKGSSSSSLAGHPRMIALAEGLYEQAVTLFRELLELRNQLFGLRDKLQLATALAHCVGLALRHVRAAPTANQAAFGASTAAFPGRAMQVLLRSAFVDAVPFTTADLCARGSLNGLRVVMASAAVAAPLLRLGMASAVAPTIAACEGLLSARSVAVTGFAVNVLAVVLAAEVPSDTDAMVALQVGCRRLMCQMPAVLSNVLQQAAPASSGRARAQAETCLRLAHAAFLRGLLSSATEGGATTAPSDVPVGFVKALFIGRRAALSDEDFDAVVRLALLFAADIVTHASARLPAAAEAALAVALPSLFQLPSSSGPIDGALARCSRATQELGASVLYFAGVPRDRGVPEPWATDARFAAAWQHQAHCAALACE